MSRKNARVASASPLNTTAWTPVIMAATLAGRSVRGVRRVDRALQWRGPNRTGDTTVFSRVLYQLGYLAAAPKCSPTSRAVADRNG